jgi:hypothetical protein
MVLLDLPHQKGWIGDPKNQAKSVALTAEGAVLAGDSLGRHYSG